MMTNDHLPQCFAKIQMIVAVNSGNKITDVNPQADLISDLGLNLQIDLPEIVYTLNYEYQAEDLNMDPIEIGEELELTDGQNVLELAKIVQEIRDLG
jgi:hypothetical protein